MKDLVLYFSLRIHLSICIIWPTLHFGKILWLAMEIPVRVAWDDSESNVRGLFYFLLYESKLIWIIIMVMQMQIDGFTGELLRRTSIGLCITHRGGSRERGIENDSFTGDGSQNQGGKTIKFNSKKFDLNYSKDRLMS